MNKTNSFRNIAYQRYSPDTVVDYNRMATSYERLISQHLQVLPEWHCLDLACGYGNFLAYLRTKGVINFVGVDLTQAAITCAAKEFGQEQVACVDAFDFLKSHKRKFDLISALDFVEHLQPDELFRLLADIHDGLNTDGLFLVRTPNASAPFGMTARYNDITHELSFTSGALGDVMQRAGFEVIDIWEDIGHPKTPLQLAHYVAWQCLRFGYRLADTIETGMWGSGIMTRNFWMLLRKQGEIVCGD